MALLPGSHDLLFLPRGGRAEAAVDIGDGRSAGGAAFPSGKAGPEAAVKGSDRAIAEATLAAGKPDRDSAHGNLKGARRAVEGWACG